VPTQRSTPERPAIDERLIMPETRHEVIDGEVLHVTPADPPHASRHSKLSALLEAYAAEGYDAASDMLTRTSEKGDMAPDGSIYPSAPDPVTGGRQLEELAFEVLSSESLSAAERKAASLVGRGVRRVFGIDVERQRALEWSAATGGWQILGSDAIIEDAALVLALPVRDLVVAVKTDDAVARALLAKNNPVLVAAIEQQRADARAEALLAVLRGRGLEVSAAQQRHIMAVRDEAALSRLLAAAGTCSSTAELVEAAGSSGR